LNHDLLGWKFSFSHMNLSSTACKQRSLYKRVFCNKLSRFNFDKCSKPDVVASPLEIRIAVFSLTWTGDTKATDNKDLSVHKSSVVFHSLLPHIATDTTPEKPESLFLVFGPPWHKLLGQIMNIFLSNTQTNTHRDILTSVIIKNPWKQHIFLHRFKTSRILTPKRALSSTFLWWVILMRKNRKPETDNR
jgi:hypothetical protein